jgi:hypothetical protein
MLRVLSDELKERSVPHSGLLAGRNRARRNHAGDQRCGLARIGYPGGTLAGGGVSGCCVFGLKVGKLLAKARDLGLGFLPLNDPVDDARAAEPDGPSYKPEHDQRGDNADEGVRYYVPH